MHIFKKSNISLNYIAYTFNNIVTVPYCTEQYGRFDDLSNDEERQFPTFQLVTIMGTFSPGYRIDR